MGGDVTPLPPPLFLILLLGLLRGEAWIEVPPQPPALRPEVLVDY